MKNLGVVVSHFRRDWTWSFSDVFQKKLNKKPNEYLAMKLSKAGNPESVERLGLELSYSMLAA